MPKGPQKLVTKKHLARLQREQNQNRYIIIVAAIVIGIVVILLGWGIVSQYVVQPRQPVAIVAGEPITTHQFQTYARFMRVQLINQYQQTQQFMQMFGSDPNNQAYFQQSLAQIEYQLDPTYLGQTVLDQLIEDKLIRQEATRLGITVSAAEVDELIQGLFRYYPNGTPTPTATVAALPTSTLSATQLALFAPTATMTATAATATATIEPTPTTAPTLDTVSTPTASPTPYTEELFQGDYKEYLDGMRSNLGMSEADLRWIYEMQLYREKVLAVITADVSTEHDQVWARHILVADEATAQAVLERLNNGEDFAAVAAEVSTDTASGAQGGDLGWFGIGMMDPAFEKVAFDLPIGVLSEPILTQFGWHIIQVLGHEVRPISPTDFETLQNTTFQDWLTAQREAANVQIFDYWQDRVPTEPALITTAQQQQP